MRNEFMIRAIELAKQAADCGEVPVGAVIVKNGCIIGEGRNTREQQKSVLGHAEINAITNACREIDDWRLNDCDIYVTLEPCPMCAGALINARIRRVYFGAEDKIFGACGTVCNSFDNFGCSTEIYSGIHEIECKALLSDFFKKRR